MPFLGHSFRQHCSGGAFADDVGDMSPGSAWRVRWFPDAAVVQAVDRQALKSLPFCRQSPLWGARVSQKPISVL